METYKRWVRRNEDYVHTMESLANGLTWLLPERFSDSEIGPEAVTSFFGIITAINEHIIETTPTLRVTDQAGTSSFPYSLCITVLKDLETLVEVAAQQFYGDDRKWNFIAATEAIKVIVRLAMFRNSGYKMLLHGGETVNIEKGSDAFSYLKQRIGDLANSGSHFGPAMMVEKPSLSTFLSEKVNPGGLFVLGEVMFIIRPLLYVLLIRKYGTRSWFPWFMSLGVDLIGNSVLSYVAMLCNSRKDPLFYLSNDERDELKRRKLLWALYLMRDPFFTKYTRKRLDHTQKLLEPVPVIGFFAEKLIELLIGAQTRYTYMSGS